MNSIRVALAALLGAALLGCTPGAGDTAPGGAMERTEVATEMAGLFTRLSPDSASSAQCFGEALASTRSVEQLRSAGLLDGDRGAEEMPTLPREDAAAWVDAWFGCVDYVEVAARAQKRATPGLDVRGFEECFAERLSPAGLREAATDGLAGDAGSRAVRRLGRTQLACAQRHA